MCTLLWEFFILLVGPTWFSVVLCGYTQVMSENTTSNTESRLIILMESSNQTISSPEKQDEEAREAWLPHSGLLAVSVCAPALLCINTP